MDRTDATERLGETETETMAALDEILSRIQSPLALDRGGGFSPYGRLAWSEFEDLMEEVDWSSSDEIAGRIYDAVFVENSGKQH